ncbi:MAG: Re/Si-specific NAD(P)(+) transhydrogenase subunit alpha [Gammaproteobacteria bacterium]|nr:Re/Si-specific NAD(P)(+) transhydrogenase subunit alpha [Gammaproteobacteria bacterium]MCP5441207.1 Re/Si-specific NAD(P)(+) transhydrogenase subunit alpha [Chromatiaceae bacterium]
MKLGIPKERSDGETRVATTPEIARKLITGGLTVLVEKGAGEAAHYTDAAYEEAGVQLTDSAGALACDIVAKVRKPLVDEIAAMREGAVFIGHAETCGEDPIVTALRARNVRAIAMERIPRISRAQSMDALSSQSNIAGYRAVIEAASHFGRFLPLMMTSAGSAKPARVVVLGVGVAGLQAIATARRLGGDVHAYDVRPETREQILSLGAKVIDLDIGEGGAGEGGYARELSEEGKAKQQALLADELSKAHIIVSTALIPCRPAPVLITEEVVERMRAGSVIVDLAAANGGNCPLTEADRVVTKHGVILVGHTNYPAMMPTDASAFYAKNIASLLEIMLDRSGEGVALKDLDEDEITRAAQLKAPA